MGKQDAGRLRRATLVRGTAEGGRAGGSYSPGRGPLFKFPGNEDTFEDENASVVVTKVCDSENSSG